jgi:hypothetical protein
MQNRLQSSDLIVGRVGGKAGVLNMVNQDASVESQNGGLTIKMGANTYALQGDFYSVEF